MSFSRQYTLFSPTGMEVTLLEAGAAVTSVSVCDRRGVFANVALPLRSLDDSSCAGATLAPYAGRIARAEMEIDRELHQLTRNEGLNHIHGGANSLVHQHWRFEKRFNSSLFQEITFSGDLAEGTDGYPGNRHFTVTYRLWINQQLEILLTAATDRPTRVNLSNHAYFNLSGDFSQDVSRHLLTVEADEVYINDDEFLMIGRMTPPPVLDFRQAREIGSPCAHPQIERARGLNHCYILRREKEKPAATLVCPDSGRRMQLYTDQPCLMVYSGGYLDTPNCAIALEAQEHPLSPCADKQPVLYPGALYQRRIVYHFDTV